MPTAIRAPRLNNNDDTVRVSQILVRVGTGVRAGDTVAEIETDKATVTVEADRDGYVLDIPASAGDLLEVGSVLLWTGDRPDEPVPAAPPAATAGGTVARRPTLKAAALIADYGIDAAAIVPSRSRLSADDVRAFAAARGLAPLARERSAARRSPVPDVVAAPGTRVRLTPRERAMARTVSWHHQEAVAGYVEVRYDAGRWNRYAKRFRERHGLLLNPQLSLMAWWLAQIAHERPALNATIVDDEKHLYDAVNLGFTVQSPSALYLVVIEAAHELSARAFCDRLAERQRHAMTDSLRPEEVSRATIAFTSMARWNVYRHMPILAPMTALMVAHTAPFGREAVLGATYDHRLLTGGEVVTALQQLAMPPEHR